MRIVLTASAVIALATILSVRIAGQEGAATVQAPPPVQTPAPGPAPAPFVPIPTEPSDLLTHSALVDCSADEAYGADTPTHVRVATWNIQAVRASTVQGIAAEVRLMQADVIALQEVDVRVRRTGFVDEPAALAAALGFQYVFAGSIKWDQGDYGIALLSRWPIADARRFRLDASEASEPRIALEVVVCVAGRPLRLINHHADNRAASRAADFAQLKGIVEPEVGRGVLVLGDFNERPGGAGVRNLLDAGMIDLLNGNGETPVPPGFRVDYVLADPPLARRMSPAQVWRTDKSDHNAVFTDLRW